jgi:hypothetical protein
MRALTLLQPWASLVAVGMKKWETRRWGTAYRGPLAIHSSKTFKRADRNLCHMDIFKQALQAGGIIVPGYPILYLAGLLPRGCIVAICELTDCVLMDEAAGSHMSALEQAFGDWTPGRFAWHLERIERLPIPIPAQGHLQLWNYDLPSRWREWGKL